MSKHKKAGEVSARARVRALGLPLAAVLGNLVAIPEGEAVATSVGVGEFLAAALCVVQRTALHEALASLDEAQRGERKRKGNHGGRALTIADWKAALTVSGDSVGADAFSKMLDRDAQFGNLFTKMLQPENRDAVLKVGQTIWDAGKMVTADTPTGWSGGAPHPKGQDVATLINALKNFSETGSHP